MYRACIFCSAPLGANEAVERFPVGRSLAFDAEKGRLWAVCPRCARWNLAPIEERWEAVEDAERLFRDTRLRVQSENVGLARLPDGTRLVRVGKALEGELAVWRYGRMLVRRHTTYRTAVGIGVAIGVGFPAALAVSVAAGLTGAAVALGTAGFVWSLWDTGPPRMQSRSFLPYTGVAVKADNLREGRFALTSWSEVSVALPGYDEDDARLVDGDCRAGWLVPSADYARMLLRRGMVQLNARGAPADRVDAAVGLLSASGSSEAFLRRAAEERAPLVDAALDAPLRDARMLAAEMAVHEELERDALRGELAALEAAWQQAEEIAGIADRLPDEDPLPDEDAEPPRLVEEY
jgi:hypothetical protein